MLPEFKAKARAKVNLPAPARYRQAVPIFGTAELSRDARRGERRRLVLWFGVALGLHVALLLALFLTPPLRLKASYGADRWVHIMPIPAVSNPPVTASPQQRQAPTKKPSPILGPKPQPPAEQ